jgi:hypothetical protein
VTGLSNVGFYAAIAVGVVLWLLPALILATTYALCERSAERAYRQGHRDGWDAAEYQAREVAAADHAAGPIANGEVQSDARLMGIAAQLVDIADKLASRERAPQ